MASSAVLSDQSQLFATSSGRWADFLALRCDQFRDHSCLGKSFRFVDVRGAGAGPLGAQGNVRAGCVSERPKIGLRLSELE